MKSISSQNLNRRGYDDEKIMAATIDYLQNHMLSISKSLGRNPTMSTSKNDDPNVGNNT